MWRRVHIKAVPAGFRTAVRDQMLGRGDGAWMRRIVALNAANEVHRQLTGKVRIFPIGLLSPAPARITKDVDVGRPDGQAFVAGVIVTGTHGIELRTRFGGYGGADV